MSTFYVLPPRPILGERFTGYLKALLPGLSWNQAAWGVLLDDLVASAGNPDTYVLYRDDLPEEENLGQALVDGFGAEAGDHVVEIQPGAAAGSEMTARHWCLGEAA